MQVSSGLLFWIEFESLGEWDVFNPEICHVQVHLVHTTDGLFHSIECLSTGFASSVTSVLTAAEHTRIFAGLLRRTVLAPFPSFRARIAKSMQVGQ